jgi:signal transduction histidine kinase
MSPDVRRGRKLASLGVGLPGMRERLGQHRGHLEVKSGPKGTRVTAMIPVPSMELN